MNALNKYIPLISRILLGLIFVLAGAGKLADPAGTAGYISSVGLPGGLLVWPTIALEVLGGLAVIVGYQTRYASLALAAFCVVSGALFHNNFADQTQMIMFMKNLAMTGGFLQLYLHGAGPLAVDKA
ncbi:MAG: DoxX family protein [Cypionkella sp.]|nr:DoxX family protein [Cypionkella sp.]